MTSKMHPRPIPQLDPEQISVPCLFMRGGSSRGGVFLEQELPADPKERAALFLAIYGSPDMRQINGIGGADPLTSKAAVVGLCDCDGADLTYTFYQIGIDRPKVSTGGNCGNMLAAVVPFAVHRGLLPANSGELSVRVLTTNTNQVVTVSIQTQNGVPKVEGTASVAGVPGTGSPITIDFGDCGGSVSGKLLPTGAPRDTISLGDKTVNVSLVDAATPFVFVDAPSLGVSGTETPAEMSSNLKLMSDLESVRGWAAEVLGMVLDSGEAATVTPNVPRVMMVAAPQTYMSTNGIVAATDVDLCVRQLAMQRPHNTLAVTGSVCAAVASNLEGTLPFMLARHSDSGRIRLGHPAGVLNVAASVDRMQDGPRIRKVSIERTARLIFSGYVHAGRSHVEDLRKIVEIDKPTQD